MGDDSEDLRKTPTIPEDQRGESGLFAKTIRPDQTLRWQPEDLLKPGAADRGTLVVIDGTPADIGTTIVIQQRLIIGREPDGLQLRDGRISRRHAEVRHEGGEFVVHDLGSTNGTLVNGMQVEKRGHTLQDGDRIFVGQSVVKFGLVDQREANYLQRMAELAGTDKLTGLPAKHRFDAALEDAFKAATGAERPLTMMMMDMDGLKAINDANGHQHGANTIACVGRIIGDIVGHRGEASRFGGDEFSVFLPGIDLQGAKRVAERIRLSVEDESFTLAGITVHATISIGVADRSGVSSVEELVAKADAALYRAKAKGRNCVSD